MPKHWRNFLIAAVVIAGFIALKVSGPVSTEAMGQVLIAALIVIVWLIVAVIRSVVGRKRRA